MLVAEAWRQEGGGRDRGPARRLGHSRRRRGDGAGGSGLADLHDLHAPAQDIGERRRRRCESPATVVLSAAQAVQQVTQGLAVTGRGRRTQDGGAGPIGPEQLLDPPARSGQAAREHRHEVRASLRGRRDKRLEVRKQATFVGPGGSDAPARIGAHAAIGERGGDGQDLDAVEDEGPDPPPGRGRGGRERPRTRAVAATTAMTGGRVVAQATRGRSAAASGSVSRRTSASSGSPAAKRRIRRSTTASGSTIDGAAVAPSRRHEPRRARRAKPPWWPFHGRGR